MDQFILKAAELARSSPTRWQEFLRELRNYSDLRAKECVQAPLDTLQRAQGRAQEAAHLHAILERAVTAATAIIKAGNKGP